MSERAFGESPVVIVEEGSVGLVETKYFTFAKEPDQFRLENGLTLGPVTVAYETYGALNEAADNAILVEHALTASAHAAGRHASEDKVPGWWDVMIGPGKAFDTEKYFVVCSNILGGCYGTTGPSSVNPATGKPYGLGFPMITIKDMVRVQNALLDSLGVRRIKAVAGGSMGGMQAMEWALSYPGMVDSIVLVASGAVSNPQSIAIHKVGIRAIMDDPDWKGGDYYGGNPPAKGLAIARMIGHITYLSHNWLWEKFGRNHPDPVSMTLRLDSNFDIEDYLEHQGRRFVERFDANSYIYIMRAIDIYDAAEGYGSLAESFSRMKCKKALVASFTSDWLFPPYQSREVVDAIRGNNVLCDYHDIDSPYGHDSFLLEYRTLTESIKEFLSSF
ncbi:MAG: homoserine O-acetyltransferase [Candidatus Dadabacteria bacterium]|nr:homoserine O-acetyltransferase [Candidatus Dadabacteria bacterium]